LYKYIYELKYIGGQFLIVQPKIYDPLLNH